LMSVVWDEHWFRSTKTLDVTMVGLRRRLREAAEAAGALVPEIMTIRGVGYRLDPPGKIDLARAR
jgi:DNA-binding response OmpR family regulator